MTFLENTVYLDNSSTTKPCGRAIEEIDFALANDFGNPSSLHFLGFNAEKKINAAREKIAEMLSCGKDEIYFTSGGTEGNNTAIFGAAYSRKKRGNRIVTTGIEHPSVLEPVKRLEEEGFEVVRIRPQSDGTISEESIAEAINEKTILVSIMLVNNETGAILPVSSARRAIDSKGAPALLHCDCVQAFGKININIKSLGADIVTASGHKIHGPKGIGFMYVKKGVTIKPLMLGGGQEKGFRSGTEPVPAICGLYGALSEIGDIGENLKRTQELCDYAKEKLSEIECVRINSGNIVSPYVLNFSVVGYRSETLLHFLERENIFVSSGSACARGKGSYVLNGTGLPRERVDSALRISFSRYNTADDIDRLVLSLGIAINTLRKVK